MTLNPEYHSIVPLSEKSNIMRHSVGNGSGLITEVRAKQLLASEGINWVLNGQLNISSEPQFIGMPRLMPRHLERPPVSRDQSIAQQAAEYLLRYSDALKDGSVDGTIITMQTEQRKEIEGFVLNFDVGVGIEHVNTIVNSIEETMCYDDIEGITNPTVKAYVDWYKSDPLAVVEDASSHNAERFQRGNDAAGIYVPEFLAKGVEHGNKVFANIYQILSSYFI